MTVHHFINSYALTAGGAERLVRHLHLGLCEQGVASRLFGLEVHADSGLDRAVSLGLASSYDARAFWGIRRYVVDHVQPGDLIHAHLFPTILYLSLLKILGIVEVPLLCTEHSTSNRRRKQLGGRLIDALSYAGVDRVVAISQGVADALVHWKPDLAGKTTVIPNGVPLPFTRCPDRSPTNRPVIVSVGNLRPAKNYGNALAAIALLGDLPFRYLVAGDGPQRRRLEEQSRSLGIESRVSFLGQVKDIPSLLERADIFLIPSRYEGFGLAAVEAMNAGLPLVASDVDGLREVVDCVSPCALRVDPDSPASIATALRTLLVSDRKRRELGKNGFFRARDFDQHWMILGYRQLYGEMLR